MDYNTDILILLTCAHTVTDTVCEKFITTILHLKALINIKLIDLMKTAKLVDRVDFWFCCGQPPTMNVQTIP